MRLKLLRLLFLAAALAVLTNAVPAQTRQWPVERPPAPLAARGVKFPPYEIRTLPNGLQVVTVLHHEQPAVSIRMLVRAGAAQDPSGKPGVAALLASLLDQGTTTKTAAQIAESIDSIGGALDTGAGSDLSFVNVLVMKDSFDLAMALMSDVVRHPAFAREEIDRQRQQTISGLRVSYDDPDYVADIVFDRLVYGFHPYGMPNNGTPESVAAIGAADLQAFHEAYFAPNNCILAIVGDVTADEAFGGAEKTFGDWKRKEVPAPKPLDAPQPTRRVIVIDKPGAVQTEVRVGHLGIPRKHADYMALDLAVKILGGEGSNRLHRVLRSERGLTYGAEADIETLKYSGDIVAETDTRSDASAEVLRLIVDEFWNLQRGRVGEGELADAKAYLAGSFPLTIETPDAIAMQVLNVLFYGLDLSELATFRERVNAVTVDDIQRVARTYLKPDRLAVVLVGDAAAFTGKLRGAGFASYEQIPLEALDLTTADFRHRGQAHTSVQASDPAAGMPGEGSRPTTAAPVAEADRIRARQLIDKAIQAKGGLEKLRSVKTITASATMTLFTPAGPEKASSVTYIEYPDRFRVDLTAPVGAVVQTYADGEAWIQDPRGVRSAPDDMRESFRERVRRDVIPLLLGAAAGEFQIRPAPDSAGDGKMLPSVEIAAAGFEPVVLSIDPDSGLIVKETYRTRGPAGDETQEELFSDYRPVDGLQVAFKAVVRRDGTTLLDRVVSDFRYNTTLAPTLFRKP